MVKVELIERLNEGLDYKTVHDFLENPRRVDVFISSVVPAMPAEVREHIDRKWEEEQKKRAEKSIQPMKDGDILAFDIQGITDNGSTLMFPLFETKYRVLIGTRFNQTPSYSTVFLGSGAITLLKAEGTTFYLFGKRAPHMTAVGGRVEVIPQGLLKKDDLSKNDPLEVTILREAQEEEYNPLTRQLPREQVEAAKFDLSVTPYWSSAAVNYLLVLKDEIWLKESRRTDKKNHVVLVPPKPGEHSEFYAVPEESIEAYLEEHLEAQTEDEKLGVATRSRLSSFFKRKDLLLKCQ